jgi:hypothetical protein
MFNVLCQHLLYRNDGVSFKEGPRNSKWAALSIDIWQQVICCTARFFIKEEKLTLEEPQTPAVTNNQSPGSESNPGSQYGEERFLYYHHLTSVDKQSLINVWTDRQTIMYAGSVTGRMLAA